MSEDARNALYDADARAMLGRIKNELAELVAVMETAGVAETQGRIRFLISETLTTITDVPRGVLYRDHKFGLDVRRRGLLVRKLLNSAARNLPRKPEQAVRSVKEAVRIWSELPS